MSHSNDAQRSMQAASWPGTHGFALLVRRLNARDHRGRLPSAPAPPGADECETYQCVQPQGRCAPPDDLPLGSCAIDIPLDNQLFTTWIMLSGVIGMQALRRRRSGRRR
jgi:hypothetical protein